MRCVGIIISHGIYSGWSKATPGVAGLVKDAIRRACLACFEERGEHFGMSDWFDASTHI